MAKPTDAVMPVLKKIQQDLGELKRGQKGLEGRFDALDGRMDAFEGYLPSRWDSRSRTRPTST
jgi:hypothetical protein